MPNLAHSDGAVQVFTAVHSEGKPATGVLIIQKEVFYDEMKVTDKCIFAECWLRNLGTV
jgi:hypothetical protein